MNSYGVLFVLAMILFTVLNVVLSTVKKNPKEDNSFIFTKNEKNNSSKEKMESIKEYTNKFKEYTSKRFMTNYESDFLKKFIHLEQEMNVKIVPQVNLATIINKINGGRFQNELYRNIDFGIFSSDYNQILLLIEINDSTHKNPERWKRDKTVDEICEKANIALIKFYTHMPNEDYYVQNRIKEYINKAYKK